MRGPGAPAKIVAIGEAMVEFAPAHDGLYHRGYAGDSFNTLWHMAQLLGDRADCHFVTRIGTDGVSDGFLSLLTRDGLSCAGVSRDPTRTMGLYLIELDGAERSFVYWRATSAARQLADDPEHLARAVSGADLLYLSGITLAILPPEGLDRLFAVLAAERQSGAQLVFDPNYRPKLWPSADAARAAIKRLLPLTDIVLPSFEDEQALWQDGCPEATAIRYRAAGVAEVVVKNGGADIAFATDGGSGSCALSKADRLRDTSGAGDAFNAGYLSARLSGAPLDEAIQAGHDLASLVLAHPGARAPRAEVRARDPGM